MGLVFWSVSCFESLPQSKFGIVPDSQRPINHHWQKPPRKIIDITLVYKGYKIYLYSLAYLFKFIMLSLFYYTQKKYINSLYLKNYYENCENLSCWFTSIVWAIIICNLCSHFFVLFNIRPKKTETLPLYD